MARAASRSARYGETSATRATTPASASSAAAWAVRRTFSARSSGLKPRLPLRPWRRLSPSSRSAGRPAPISSASTSTASVDLPEAGSPVSQTVAPLKPSVAARSCGVTAPSCQRVFAVFIVLDLTSGGRASARGRLVQPALRLVHPGPAAGAAGARERAVRAADRVVALVVQRVVGQVVGVDVGPDVALAPVGERVRLPESVARVPVDLLRVRTVGGLLAPHAGDPALRVGERPLERLHLAQEAAAVRVGGPHAGHPLAAVGLDGDAVALLDE